MSLTKRTDRGSTLHKPSNIYKETYTASLILARVLEDFQHDWKDELGIFGLGQVSERQNTGQSI